MIVTIVSKKGQIVIPAVIRQKYNLKQGDRLAIKDLDGRIVLEPLDRYPLLAMRGAFKDGPCLTKMLLVERSAERSREAGKSRG